MFVIYVIITLTICDLYSIDCFNVDTEFPIIFKSSFGENVETYFGLAVDMQNIGNQIKFIIGAPKANSTLYQVKHSGTVFKCELTNNITTVCNEININFRRINPLNRIQNKAIQVKPTADMFLGGTIASKPNSGQVLVCAHLWTNEFQINRPDHQINPSGSCFMLDLQKNYEQPIGIFPLTDPNLQYKDSTYYYSHAMSGFSATFTESGDDLLLGAPGFYQWRGTTLETNDINSGTTNTFVREKFFLHQNYRFQTDSYLGYSLVSGHFLAGIKTSIATGAPRDLNYRGRVYIYNLANSVHSEETTVLFANIDGTKMGEYFGAALLAVNINNDEFTDLVIGAPFYAQISGDRGRVYVYISNGNGFNGPQILIGSDAINARFGTSLANLGDINSDGFNDIAIGAPYEDDGFGSVYIYSGGKTGIITPYAQRISSKQHLSGINLRGFGISISGNKDIDNNYYPDLLIGSYLSNKALLLRTKPIAKIKAIISLDNDHINVDDHKCPFNKESANDYKLVPCVKMWYCIEYSGAHIPQIQNLNITFKLDSRRENSRCFIQSEGQELTSFTKIVTLNANTNIKCFDELIVYLRNKTNIDDIYSPIEFSLSYNLIPIQSGESFCSHCPTILGNQTTKQLYFETGCNSDEKCISNLKLSAIMLVNNISMNKTSILEGFHKNLTLIINIRNNGEPSYLTKLLVKTKPLLDILKQDTRCKLPKTSPENDDKLNFIECDAGNPLENGSEQEIIIPFDITQLDFSIKNIELYMELKTASEITPESQMYLNLTVKVERNASLQIFGSSLKSEMLYESEQNRKSDFVPFSGLFQVIKQNSSTVENVYIEITFGSIFQGRPLVFRPHIQIIRGVSVNCNRTISALPVLPLKVSSGAKTSLEYSTNRQKRTIIKQKNEVENKKTLILDCNSKIECFKVECYAGPFKQDKDIAQFIIHSGINLTSIQSIYGKDYQTIKLQVEYSAKILDQQISGSEQYITTDFIFKSVNISVERIEKWIIIVSAVVGLLILIIIIIVLIKIGFFRRKQKEEMENMAKDSGSLLGINEIDLKNDLKNYDSSDDLDNDENKLK